jgi:hypothetical protein
MAFDPAILPSLLGLGAKIGGAIPGLKKPKRTNAAGRAGAQATSQAAGSAVGASQAGQGASRGLALRSGIRSAAKVANEASGAAANAARTDEAVFQAEMNERTERIGEFASGIGEAGAQMTQALIDPEKADAKTGARGMTKNANSEASFEQAAQTMTTDERPTEEGTPGDDDEETKAIQHEVSTLMKNAALAEDDDPRFSGPHADFATTERLEALRTKSPTVAGPQIEQALENRLRAQKMMRQDAERMGMNLHTIWPMISRQMQLKPGQGLQNPLGIAALEQDDEGTE